MAQVSSRKEQVIAALIQSLITQAERQAELKGRIDELEHLGSDEEGTIWVEDWIKPAKNDELGHLKVLSIDERIAYLRALQEDQANE